MSRYGGVPIQADGRVARMRVEFDSAFSRSPVVPDADLTDVLGLRIGDEPCWLRLTEIAEVIAHPVFTPVPTSVPTLIGLGTGRGLPIGAYDLGLLLGRGPVKPRWLVLAAAEPGVGLAFEHFDGYQRIPLGPDGSRRLVEMSTLIDRIARLSHRRSSDLEVES